MRNDNWNCTVQKLCMKIMLQNKLFVINFFPFLKYAHIQLFGLIYDHCNDPALSTVQLLKVMSKKKGKKWRFIEKSLCVPFYCKHVLLHTFIDKKRATLFAIIRIIVNCSLSLARECAMKFVLWERHHNLFYCTHLTAFQLTPSWLNSNWWKIRIFTLIYHCFLLRKIISSCTAATRKKSCTK